MKKSKTNREVRAENIRASIAQNRANGGPPSRLQEMVAESSPVSGWQRGDPFFDPWTPGGTFNKPIGEGDDE
ncbi:UNVERIFIED_CONTAM: hypothetical protein BEN50_22260 [Euhalothece sp. KZN 001]